MLSELPPSRVLPPLVARWSKIKSGFTLLETLVALLLLVILTVVIVAVYRHHVITSSGGARPEVETERPARTGPAGVMPRDMTPADETPRRVGE